MLKKALVFTFLFSLSFAVVALAASSAKYDGGLVASITSVNSIDVTGKDMKIQYHEQSNTKGRTVNISAYKKGLLGYSFEKNIANVTADTGAWPKSYSVTGLTNGTYKLKFTETSGKCSSCGLININGTFKD